MPMNPNAKCRVIRGGEERNERQGIFVREGVSEAKVGAEHLFMAYQSVPPLTRSKIHWHENCESGAFVLSGRLRIHIGTEYGQEVIDIGAGDFAFIPPGGVHAVENPDPDERCVCIIARNTSKEVYQDLTMPPPKAGEQR
jgi:uncharacterized RmlC-like cupin family protein